MLYRPGLLGRMPCAMDWYWDVAGPPTIDDSFVGVIPVGWTFTRSSANATNCLYTDTATAPAFTTYAANAPRFLDFGLLMEPIRTNLFLNSEAPVGQTITVAVGYYTCWFIGPGSAVVQVVAGTAVINTPGQANVGVPFTWQVTTAGTVVVTIINGPVTRVQIEKGTTPTSYIVSTATAQTRQEDRLSKNYLGGQLNAVQGTYWVEFLAQVNFNDAMKSESSGRIMVASSGGSYSSNNASDQIASACINGASNTVQSFFYNDAGASQSGTKSVNVSSIGRVSRCAMSVSPTRNSYALDYVFGGSAAASGDRPSALLVVCLGGGGAGGNGNNGGAAGSHIPFNGFIRGFRYWPVAMPDAELKECTEPGYYQCPPVFDLSFLGGASAFPRRWLHTRGAATGTPTDSVYDDAPGSTFNTYTGNTPKMTSRGLLMDASHSNLFVPNVNPVNGNSGNLGVQTYCCWMIGTGSFTVAPNTAAGTGWGTGSQGNPVWVVISTAGTAAVTFTGSVNRFQIEQQGGNAPGAVLPRTFLNATATNQVSGGEWATVPIGSWYDNTQGTYYFEFSMLGYTSSWFLFSVWSGSDNQNREQIFNIINAPAVAPTMNFRGNTLATPTLNLGGVDSVPVVGGVDLIASRVHKVALTYNTSVRMIVLNGQMKTDFPPGTSFNALPRPQPPALFGLATDATAVAGTSRGNGYYRRVRYYDYAMTQDQLVALTT